MNEDLDRAVPELLAWRDRGRFRVWCEFCKSFHTHRKTGWVEAKCPMYTAYTPTGYIVVDSGRWHSGRTLRYSSRKL
jgi:hypothetical protein